MKRQSIKFNPFTKISKIVFVNGLKNKTNINVVNCPIYHKCNLLEGEYIIRKENTRIHTWYNYVNETWYLIKQRDSSNIYVQAFNIETFNLFPTRTTQFWDNLKNASYEILNHKWKVLQLAYIERLEYKNNEKRLRIAWLKIKKLK